MIYLLGNNETNSHIKMPEEIVYEEYSLILFHNPLL